MKKIKSTLAIKIVLWFIKFSITVLLFIVGYSRPKDLSGAFMLVASGIYLSILADNIEEFLRERKKEKEDHLIDQIGK